METLLTIFNFLILPILAFCDVLFTYKIGKITNKLEFELNPFVKKVWKKYGLKKGQIIWGFIEIIFFIILLIISYYIFNLQIRFYLYGAIFGALIVVNFIHLSNLDYINKKIRRENRWKLKLREKKK